VSNDKWWESSADVCKDGEGKAARDGDGHLEYIEEEPEMHHGWTGSWRVDDDDTPKKNDMYYGVKLGTILHYAEEKAKNVVKSGPKGSKFSSPRAKFHQNLSDEAVLPKGEGEAATIQDVIICRARHTYLDTEAFQGDDNDVYSSMQWTHDGTVGFSHTGCGWKNREFHGHIFMPLTSHHLPMTEGLFRAS